LEYFKDAYLYALKHGLKLLSEDGELDAEAVCIALDVVSQRVKCPKANQILPIYRVPCFNEYLDDHSIIEVESERANLKCTHECEFRHAKTGNGKLAPIGLFITTLFIGHSTSKLPALNSFPH
jgi:hypothetical protein